MTEKRERNDTTMQQGIYTVLSNNRIAKNTYEMALSGDTSALSRPGQFLNIRLDGFYLRRPISVCDYEEGRAVIVYKTVGAGTEAMAALATGAKLDILMGLGNGFDTSKSTDTPLLIGGGAGVPPMYGLAKRLVAEGKKPAVILGFNTEEEIFYEQEFKELGVTLYLATADGSRGTKGFVTDVMKRLTYGYFYTCGPMPMFRAIESIAVTGGEYSFEERMGCGFGACMGCSCETLTGGYKRICKDGPVLEREEIRWTQA